MCDLTKNAMWPRHMTKNITVFANYENQVWFGKSWVEKYTVSSIETVKRLHPRSTQPTKTQ